MAEEASINGKTNASGSEDRDAAFNSFRSATSVSMSPEMFEKLCLTSQRSMGEQLKKTFANPTP
ncbi:hypothetical protein E4U43_006295, partial [Claviceps pusilla]